ncbi:hypothetical protein [Streptomyces sp. NBC_01190]|uniref:hypothetical protein n=1 Tax=Streptomyces sp. NBC_01190 TaxID=2903767 RepID=UPI00386CDE0E|nr:hypothetical protein OG519_29730 [Streptomyces sp. NBC_01190]
MPSTAAPLAHVRSRHLTRQQLCLCGVLLPAVEELGIVGREVRAAARAQLRLVVGEAGQRCRRVRQALQQREQQVLDAVGRNRAQRIRTRLLRRRTGKRATATRWAVRDQALSAWSLSRHAAARSPAGREADNLLLALVEGACGHDDDVTVLRVGVLGAF